MTAKAGDVLFIMDADGNSIPSVVRLDQIANTLRGGGTLDNGLRRELIELVEYAAFKQVQKSWIHSGRQVDPTMRLCAAIVYQLHTHHGIKVLAAVSAMVREDIGTEESRRKLRQNVKRAYQSLKASGEKYPVNERVVLEALTRINPSQKVK